MTVRGMYPPSLDQLMVMGCGPVAVQRMRTRSPGRTICRAGSSVMRGGAGTKMEEE